MSIKDVAKLAGVSPSTVSSVFTGNQTVSEATAKRVLKVAKELNYYPSNVARSLRYGVSKTIAVVVDDLHSPSLMSVLSGIEDAAFKQKFTVFIADSSQRSDKETYYIKSVIGHKVAGVLLEPSGNHISLYEELNRLMPVVLIDRFFPNLSISSVAPDHEKGARLATNHLADHGHNHIGIITGPLNLAPGSQRLRGFLEAANSLGISTEERLIRSGPSNSEFGFTAAKSLLEANKDMTALYTTTGSITLGAIQALFESNINIPNDVAFIGSGSLEWAGLVKPAITSIVYDFYAMGTTATQFLFSLIGAPSMRDKLQNIVIKPKIEIRQSCGCK
ncbi:MAG: LacI family DNA-binding transcriptional regulator [Bacillota bacterium]